MNVELACLGDVIADTLEQDGVDEILRNGRCAGDEDAGTGVDGVGCPEFRSCERQECLDGGERERREDLEWFWEFAGLVSREYEGDPGSA